MEMVTSDLDYWEQEAQNNAYDPYILTVYAYHLHADQQSHKALDILDQALEVDPTFTQASVIKGAVQLSLGDYDNGWPNHELWHKQKLPETYEADCARLWDGQPTDDLVIVRSDQGFGDCIQFVRYLPMVLEKCSKTLIIVQPELETLISQSFPNLTFAEYIKTPDEKQMFVRCSPKDVATLKHAPISSLGAIFKTTVDTIPNNTPYLKAKKAIFFGKKIGISWDTEVEGERTYVKNIPDEIIKPLLDREDAISLRYKDLNVSSFAETAAVINGLDLVITGDTCIAHLAGALAKPTWILLSKDCDWRWFQNRTDSPWYPTARLFRQQHAGDWQPIITDIMRELSLDNSLLTV